MRLSCNGCRVLRKGCSEDCTIRPCLQWLKCAEAQANATVFLAKFYGRAGLLNLINTGPDHLRPAIFRSLLYEACGRIVNPIYGSVGLLSTSSWQHCQAAVEAVLRGEPIPRLPSNSLGTSSSPVPLLKSCDIRHVPKESRAARTSAALLGAPRTRTRFKHSAAAKPVDRTSALFGDLIWPSPLTIDFRSPPSDESASHDPGLITARGARDGDARENESAFSEQTVEASHVSQAEPVGKVELELTLGFERAPHASDGRGRCMMGEPGFAAPHTDVRFQLLG